MHIPDGYLSPSTCAVLYAGAAPFWIVALRKMRALYQARLIPLLSLCSAFSFVVMMFNLPLPGGTTGHAVGVTLSTILLGPWLSILAISVALVIQAVFFGDGGITALGANCFNMAMVGSFVAWVVYTLISGHSPLTSGRRVLAAAVAGYLALNASALCAAFEFGIQPALFHDPSGAPLYAPYPLQIALPAMMLGHLGPAGLAEALLSAGVLAWMQRANVSLLEISNPTSDDRTTNAWRITRAAWIGLAVLMIATPLGILAAGTAWGEWGIEDFKSKEARAQIAAASHNVTPPETPPAGLEKLAELWKAPIPDYAPPFLKQTQLGYIFSALLGTGLILLTCILCGALCAKPRPASP